MKTKRILSIMILLLALPTASFAARMYYDSGNGQYYTVRHDAYGNRVIIYYDTQGYYNEGLPYDNTYNYPYYYNSPYYDNYNPYPIVPLLFFGGGYGGHGGYHGGHGGFGGGHGGHHH